MNGQKEAQCHGHWDDFFTVIDKKLKWDYSTLSINIL